jgi:DNA-binding GntR family transcriptional regulator
MQKQKTKNNLTTVARESIEEKVYKILKKQILEKHIEHGSRLIQDNLAKELGTSRIPVRHALQRLEMDRLVKQNSRGHYFVQIMRESDIAEIYNIRILIETYAMKQALTNLCKKDFAELRRLNLEMKQSGEMADLSRWYILNLTFHLLIYKASGMPRLIEMITSLRDVQIGRSSHLIITEYIKSFNEHQAIISALESRNLQDVETLFQDHLRSAHSRWNKHLPERP